MYCEKFYVINPSRIIKKGSKILRIVEDSIMTLCVVSTLHLFIKYLLSTCYVPDWSIGMYNANSKPFITYTTHFHNYINLLLYTYQMKYKLPYYTIWNLVQWYISPFWHFPLSSSMCTNRIFTFARTQWIRKFLRFDFIQ